MYNKNSFWLVIIPDFWFVINLLMIYIGLNRISMNFECSLQHCGFKFGTSKRLVSHLKQHIKEGFSVKCPYLGCNFCYRVVSSFSAHLSCKHTAGYTQISCKYRYGLWLSSMNCDFHVPALGVKIMQMIATIETTVICLHWHSFLKVWATGSQLLNKIWLVEEDCFFLKKWWNVVKLTNEWMG